MLPLVRRIAIKLHRRLPSQVELDELVGAGSLGLVDALRKFDPRKGVKLESYASHRIRGAMLDSLRGLDPASRDLRAKCKQVAEAERRLEGRLGRAVEDSEVASELGLNLAQLYRLKLEISNLGFEFRDSNFEIRVSDADDPFRCCYRREQQEILKRSLAGLPKREQVVLSLYYHEGLRMRGIAERLGVDESRVSQIHSVARARLRKRVNAVLQNGHGRSGNLLRMSQILNEPKSSPQIW